MYIYIHIVPSWIAKNVRRTKKTSRFFFDDDNKSKIRMNTKVIKGSRQHRCHISLLPRAPPSHMNVHKHVRVRVPAHSKKLANAQGSIPKCNCTSSIATCELQRVTHVLQSQCVTHVRSLWHLVTSGDVLHVLITTCYIC